MDYPKSVPGVGLVNGKFVDDNPITGAPGSLIPAEWGNGVTEEIVNVIRSAGLEPDEAKTDQLVRAIRSLGSQDFKNSVRAASTTAMSLSGTQPVDNVAIAVGDRVLVKNQALAAQNGIFVVQAGAWVRAGDFASNADVTTNAIVAVDEGAVNGSSIWQLVTTAPIDIGVTPLSFEVAVGPTGVVPGVYRSVTVDKRGRVQGGSNPSTLQGYGITDGMPNDRFVYSASAPLPTDGTVGTLWLQYEAP
ncbi:hypothetical protein [Pseudomonas gingeri]|uniref:hypothetical protein n=1 Tax=Pseudomonas gingeri TaxID=117681 RepID=UPI002109D939|nr:hypothetical protein [Pseudomonas gingeri]